MAHYTSDSHLWSDRHFLACSRLERLIVLYIMHGPGRSNVPGLCEDSAVTIADRLEEPVDDVRPALKRMCEDPDLLRMDETRRMISCPLALRMDPYRGTKTMRGWHKNWAHMAESPVKYDHIELLVAKVDRTKETEIEVWNETFGAESGARYRLEAQAPPQQELPLPKPPRKTKGRKPPRQAPRVESSAPLPHRDGVEHMDAGEYVERFSADLLAGGAVREMGASVDMFSSAMQALIKKAPGHKRAAEWDMTALNFVETEIYIAKRPSKQGHTHENNRSGSGGARRSSRAANRGTETDDSEGQWGEVVRRKAAATSAAADP